MDDTSILSTKRYVFGSLRKQLALEQKGEIKICYMTIITTGFALYIIISHTYTHTYIRGPLSRRKLTSQSNLEGLELDSGSSVGGSLPSPGATSCSLDGASTRTSPSCALMEHEHSPVAVVNGTQATAGPVGEPPLSQRVGVLQQRVSNPNWYRQRHISLCLATFSITNRLYTSRESLELADRKQRVEQFAELFRLDVTK